MAECKTKTFISCIKIKGVQLLPPVISDKRRIELQRYKQQAIKLEKRLKSCRELKKNLEDLLNIQPLVPLPQPDNTFTDANHIEALGITENGLDTSILQKNNMLRKIKLNKDIVDVTQYDNDGIKIIQNNSDHTVLNQDYKIIDDDSDTFFNKANIILSQSELNKEKTKSNVIYTETSNNSEVEGIIQNNVSNCTIQSETLRNISPEKTPKPRLIRSNSYTLDSPSPILLAHLEKNRKNEETKNFENFKQLSTSRNWSSLENNYIPFENSDFSSINTVYNNQKDDFSKKGATCSTPTCKDNLSPTIEVVQADISVQQITVNTNDMDNSQMHEGNLLKNIWDVSNPNSQLMQLIKNIPEKYSQQIVELIERVQQKKMDGEKLNRSLLDNFPIKDHSKSPCYKNEHLEKERMNDIYQKGRNGNPHHSFSKSDFCNGKADTQIESEQSSMYHNISFSDSEQFLNSTTSLSPSRSIQYSLTPSDIFQPPSSPSVKLIDLEYDDDKTENRNHISSDKLKNVVELYVQDEFEKNININRKLFPPIDTPNIWTNKQEWAASVIGAHVKGYLTRRLLRTEKVQTLIDTIKDALICALQLHSTENIDESDVELHRRLINQVSAACYTFHDIFFGLSVQEQMLIISTDRQRKIEKIKRPTSAPSSRRLRTSSSRSSNQRFPPQSQSLTKV